MMKECAEA